MKIANGVTMLELQIESFAGPQELNPTLVWDEDHTVLIDTGTPGQGELIRIAINDAGVPFEKLNVIILTHQDIDHIGSLPEILQAAHSHIEFTLMKSRNPILQESFIAWTVSYKDLISRNCVMYPVGRVR
ncbi:MBL fold metallo-hydrolase [Paenibacillus wulumuqiensis]|uniref:MBL fold metallo-hydrolase n=1 Tax=Paenibacillus wulumuqiensis TaxID=1567107 RepID=UPI000A4BC622|nr:MBL fold metallo-hydrolase [Paenibacillus wulumuqiensis]